MIYDLEQRSSPLIISVPHAGIEIPDDVMRRLTPAGRTLIDTDWHVPRLYAFAVDIGATLLAARYSRYVVDCNRDPSGASLYPGAFTTGLCPTETFAGEALYAAGDEPQQREIEARRKRYWEPYHDVLRAQIERVVTTHGYALLLDGHSIWGRLPLLFEGTLPDVNVGTNDGASCSPALRDGMANVFSGSPYGHVVDGRFKGGYITRHYGVPDRNVHAVQIEINAQTYLQAGSRTEWDDGKAARLSVSLRAACETLLHVAQRTVV